MKKKSLFFVVSVLLIQGVRAANDEPADSLLSSVLDAVIVNAGRPLPDSPLVSSEMTKNDLRRFNFGQDVTYLMSRTPSAVVTSDGGLGIGYTALRVRGTSDKRMNFTLDGVPLNDAESHQLFWVNMSDIAASLENVQLQRGAGSSTHGSAAFGATLSMQSERTEPAPYMEISGMTGSYGTYKYSFKGGTWLLPGRWAVEGRLSKIGTDGYIDRSSADLASYYLSTLYYGDNWFLRYKFFGSSEQTYQAWNGVPSDSIRAGNRTYNSCGEYYENGKIQYYPQTDNYWQNHHHLSFVQSLGNVMNQSVTLHYTHGRGYYEDYKADAKWYKYNVPSYVAADGGTVSRSDLVRCKWLKNDFYGLIYNLSYKGKKWQGVLGASFNRYSCAHYGTLLMVKNYPGLLPEKYYDSDGDKWDGTLFVKANYAFTENLNGYADLQYRHIHYTIDGTNDKFNESKQQQRLDVDEEFPFFNPKFGLNYRWNAHQLYASYSVAHREPNRDNYTDAGSYDAPPASERLQDVEVGYRFKKKGWEAAVNFYYMHYRDQLILNGKISDIGESLTTNIPHSYRTGAEVEGRIPLLSWLSWYGNAAFSLNKIKDFTEYVTTYDAEGKEVEPTVVDWGGTDIALSPRWVANSCFSLTLNRFAADLQTSYVSRQYLDNTSSRSRSLSEYCVTHLNLSYRFTPDFCKEALFSLRVNNLFDNRYETNGWVSTYIVPSDGHTLRNRYYYDGLFPQAGTHFMCSLTVRF